MPELNPCTGTLIMQGDAVIECTEEDCYELAVERHDLVLHTEEITPAVRSRQVRAAG